MSEDTKVQDRPDPERERAIDATAWFSVLAHARRIGDIRRAAEALNALERLGVVVKYKRGERGLAHDPA
jgi:hypothetical protein